MNRKQIIVLSVGIIVFILIGLFPPTHIVAGGTWHVESGGRPRRGGWLDNLKIIGSENHEIDFARLCIYWGIIGAITAGLIYTFRDKKAQESKMSRDINLRRGFRRITLVLAVVAAFICAGLTVSIVISKHNNANSYLRHKQELYKNRPKWTEKTGDNWWDKYPVAETTTANKKPTEGVINFEAFVPKENRVPTAKELKEIEKGFLVNLSAEGLVGLYLLAGMGSAATGFCGIWLVYYLLEWLVLGFCEDKPKDEQKE